MPQLPQMGRPVSPTRPPFQKGQPPSLRGPCKGPLQIPDKVENQILMRPDLFIHTTIMTLGQPLGILTFVNELLGVGAKRVLSFNPLKGVCRFTQNFPLLPKTRTLQASILQLNCFCFAILGMRYVNKAGASLFHSSFTFNEHPHSRGNHPASSQSAEGTRK